MDRRSSTGTGAEYGDPRGTITVSSPARGVIVLRMSGHAPGEVLSSVTEALDRFGGSSAATDYFYDVWDMETYDSRVRVDLTAYHLKHRRLLRSLHTCARSRVVKMGVSVANIALRVIEQHDDRAAFDAALERRCRAIEPS